MAMSDGYGPAYPEIASRGLFEVRVSIADTLVMCLDALVNIFTPLWLLLDFLSLPEIVCVPSSRDGRLGSPLAVEALRGECAVPHSYREATAGHVISASGDRSCVIPAFLRLRNSVLT